VKGVFVLLPDLLVLVAFAVPGAGEDAYADEGCAPTTEHLKVSMVQSRSREKENAHFTHAMIDGWTRQSLYFS
jgi:hypothetical protein